MNALVKNIIRPRNPFVFAIETVVLFAILIIANYKWIRPGDIKSTMVFAGTGILFYCIFSCIMLVLTKKIFQTWNFAFLGFVLVFVLNTALALLITGQTLAEVAFYKKLLLLIGIVYMVMVSVSMGIRGVVAWTEQQ